jgi:hypothetical protein
MPEAALDVGIGKLFESLARLLEIKALKALKASSRARASAFQEAAGAGQGVGREMERLGRVRDSP